MKNSTSEIEKIETKYSKIINNVEVASVVVTEYLDCYNINSLFVQENYRQKGIATELLRTIVTVNSHMDLELGVREDNIIAQKLYAKFGFNTENKFLENGIKMLRQVRRSMAIDNIITCGKCGYKVDTEIYPHAVSEQYEHLCFDCWLNLDEDDKKETIPILKNGINDLKGEK